MTDLIERLTRTEQGLKLYEQERVLAAFTDLLCEVADKDGIPQEELPERLDIAPEYWQALCDGEPRALLGIRVMANMLVSLGYGLHFHVEPLEYGPKRPATEIDCTRCKGENTHPPTVDGMPKGVRWCMDCEAAYMPQIDDPRKELGLPPLTYCPLYNQYGLPVCWTDLPVHWQESERCPCQGCTNARDKDRSRVQPPDRQKEP